MNIDLIYGLNAIKNILNKKVTCIIKIYIFKINNRTFKLINYAIKYKLNISYVFNVVNLKLRYILKLHGIVIKIKKEKKNFILENFLSKSKLKVLVLNNIQDPHNLASCIRSAEAFNINLLILTEKDTSKIKTLINNISHATSLLLPILRVSNLNKIINQFKNNDFKIIGMSVKAKNYVDVFKLRESFVIILGSEKNGIKKSVMRQCDYIYKIPTFGLCDSINVAVATGIILYNIKR